MAIEIKTLRGFYNAGTSGSPDWKDSRVLMLCKEHIDELLVAADYLEEAGLGIASNLLRHQAKAAIEIAGSLAPNQEAVTYQHYKALHDSITQHVFASLNIPKRIVQDDHVPCRLWMPEKHGSD